MRKLIRGVHEFQSEIFSQERGLFERLAEGQRPETLFITCSDSRIDPNLLTQTVPGELFVLRNAGNIVPPASAAPGGEAATIEYAIVALQVRDVIVCGHSKCAAVAGLLSPQELTNLPYMADWLKHAEATKAIVSKKYSNRSADERWAGAVEENVLVQLDNLRTHPAVAAAESRDRLKLHGWVYQFETGLVLAYDPIEGRFVPLKE